MAKTNSKKNYLTKIDFKKSMSLFLTCLPPLFLVCFAIKYTVNLPFADEWYFVPLFEKMFNNTLTFGDLWAQHNEHRFLLTKLVTLANVQLTDWDLRYEIFLNLVIGAAIFMSIFAVLKKVSNDFWLFPIYWIFPTLSFLIFSLAQWENWLWGIRMNILFSALFVLAGFNELASTLNRKTIFFAVLIGLLATYSNSGGLLYWPVALLMIYINPHVLKNLKRKIITFWILITTVVILTYFYNWSPPYYGFSPVGSFAQTLSKFIQITLALLGSALESYSSKTATIFGLFGITIHAYLTTKLIKKGKLRSPLFLTLLALCLYAICNILITSFSRLKFSLTQEQLTTRYGLTSILFWVSVTILTFVYANLKAKEDRQKFRLALNHVTLSFIVIALISILALKSSFQGIQHAIERQTFLRSIQSRVISSKSSNETLLAFVEVYPLQSIGNLDNVVNSADLINAINILSKHNLSIFNEIPLHLRPDFSSF